MVIPQRRHEPRPPDRDVGVCLTVSPHEQFLLPLKVPSGILPASLLNNPRHGDEVFAVSKDKASDETGQCYLHTHTHTYIHTHTAVVYLNFRSHAIKKTLNFTERL